MTGLRGTVKPLQSPVLLPGKRTDAPHPSSSPPAAPHPPNHPPPTPKQGRRDQAGGAAAWAQTSPGLFSGRMGSHVPRPLLGHSREPGRRGCHVRGRKRPRGRPGAAPFLSPLLWRVPSLPRSGSVSRLPHSPGASSLHFPRPLCTKLSPGRVSSAESSRDAWLGKMLEKQSKSVAPKAELMTVTGV